MTLVHPPFPIDVFEEVIDQASDNIESLRLLSLTCREFLPRARYHLFSSIDIRTVQQMVSASDFLDSRPWFPPLVRKVTLSTMVPWNNPISNISLLDMLSGHLLSRLPNLRAWRLRVIQVPGFQSIKKAWLSLHRSALVCYHSYGARILNLELSHVGFNNVSDFTRLVSAFPNIHGLTCANIRFRKRLSESQHNAATTTITRSLQVQNLHVTSSDVRAVQYLINSSVATLNSVVIAIDAHLFVDRERLERLEQSMSQLSKLSSLTLIIPCGFIYWDISRDKLWRDWDGLGVSKSIHSTTRILRHVSRASLGDVCVRFVPDSIACLGSHLVSDGAWLEICQALEEALLTVRHHRIVVHQPPFKRRAGRVGFWSTPARLAFPRLNDRGLLILPHEIPAPFGHEGSVTCLVASRNSTRVVTASQDGTIMFWDPERCTVTQAWLAHRGEVSALALAPDSQRLVSACSKTLTVWDISDGVRKLAGVENPKTSVMIACAWSPDGTLIAWASDMELCIWDARTFQQLRGLLRDPPHALPCGDTRCLQFSSDARYLVWTSFSGVTIWRVLAQEQPRTFNPDRYVYEIHAVNALSLDPAQCKRLATSYRNDPCRPGRHSVVRIWDIATGAELAVLEGHSHDVYDVSFSSDGKSVLSASSDGSVKVWDAESGKEKASLEEDGAVFRRACFSPDGEYIVTASQRWNKDCKVRLWRAVDGSFVATIARHRKSVSHIAFTHDGGFLASGDEEGIVRMCRLSDFIGHSGP